MCVTDHQIRYGHNRVWDLRYYSTFKPLNSYVDFGPYITTGTVTKSIPATVASTFPTATEGPSCYPPTLSHTHPHPYPTSSPTAILISNSIHNLSPIYIDPPLFDKRNEDGQNLQLRGTAAFILFAILTTGLLG
jgi:hypothetical protein